MCNEDEFELHYSLNILTSPTSFIGYNIHTFGSLYMCAYVSSRVYFFFGSIKGDDGFC